MFAFGGGGGGGGGGVRSVHGECMERTVSISNFQEPSVSQ